MTDSNTMTEAIRSAIGHLENAPDGIGEIIVVTDSLNMTAAVVPPGTNLPHAVGQLLTAAAQLASQCEISDLAAFADGIREIFYGTVAHVQASHNEST